MFFFRFVWSCCIFFVIFVKHFWIGNLFYQWVWLQFCINLVARVTYVLQLGYGTLRSAVHVRFKPRQHIISPIGFAIIVWNFIKFQSAKILWQNTSYTSSFVSHSKTGKNREVVWVRQLHNWNMDLQLSPHGLNGHVLLISYIWIWSNYTELGRRHPQMGGFLVRESLQNARKIQDPGSVLSEPHLGCAMAYKDSEKRPVAGLPRPLSGELHLSAVLSSYVGDEKRLVRLRQCLESVVHQTQILGWSKGKDWRFKWTAVRVSISIFNRHYNKYQVWSKFYLVVPIWCIPKG